MKTTKIIIETYKQTDSLYEAATDLGLDPYDLFQYGEYINCLEVEIDENLNVIGGKLIPFKTPVGKYKEELV
jgi:hypothetical protein